MSDDWLYKYSEVQAQLENAQSRLNKLETFYREIIELTVKHDAVNSIDGNQYASVSPSKISDALSKVNPTWWTDSTDD